MDKITKPRKPKEEKYIFTEGINYFDNGKMSIWGNGDKAVKKILEKINISGEWLNLAAGDGRYNNKLLQKASFVVASDIDVCALSKLWHSAKTKHKPKLKIKVFNITKRFPFKNFSFDGVFCTGILHFFPEKILKSIFLEIDRILKYNGKIIIDFATDIKRILPNNKLYIRHNEPRYTMEEAENLLKQLLKKYKVKIIKSKVPKEIVKTRGMVYKFSCKFIVIIANK